MELRSYVRPTEIVERTWWEAYEDALLGERDEVRLYRDYYAGDFSQFQNILTDRQKQYIFQWRNLGWNLCARAVDGVVSRLQVVNLSHVRDEDQPSAEKIWDWFTRNKVDAGQIDLFTAAVRDGAGYLLCWYPPGQLEEEEELGPRFTVHTRFNGETGIEAVRDLDTGAIRFYRHYFKEFREDGKVIPRRDVYYPDRIEEYQHLESGVEWELLNVIEWRQLDGRPLGLPIFEFSYPRGPKLKDLLGLQDLLNKALYDLLEWSDKNIYPVKYVLGVQLAIDKDTGEPQSWEVGPDVIWHSDRVADAGAQIGQLPSGDITALLAAIQQLKKMFVEVGNLSPLDFLDLGASPWSGEALSTLERTFLAEIRKVQVYWGNEWEAVGRMFVRLNNAFGSPRLNVPLLDCQWRDPEIRDTAFWNNLVLKRTSLGWSAEQVQREAGLTEEEVERMKEELSEENASGFEAFRAQAERMTAGGEGENTGPPA